MNKTIIKRVSLNVPIPQSEFQYIGNNLDDKKFNFSCDLPEEITLNTPTDVYLTSFSVEPVSYKYMTQSSNPNYIDINGLYLELDIMNYETSCSTGVGSENINGAYRILLDAESSYKNHMKRNFIPGSKPMGTISRTKNSFKKINGSLYLVSQEPRPSYKLHTHSPFCREDSSGPSGYNENGNIHMNLTFATKEELKDVEKIITNRGKSDVPAHHYHDNFDALY